MVNKWDLIEEKDAQTARRGQDQLIEKAPFLRYVPFLYASALTGQRARKLLDLILEVADAREARVATSEVNRVLEALIEASNPPQKPGEEIKLLYASQIGTAPPTIAIVTNRLESECEDTRAIFRTHQLSFDAMLCRDEKGPSDKNPRFESVALGKTPAGQAPLDVVAFVGDNILDFPGLTQAIRQAGEGAFSEFGVRFFLLPNPMYGSWER